MSYKLERCRLDKFMINLKAPALKYIVFIVYQPQKQHKTDKFHNQCIVSDKIRT